MDLVFDLQKIQYYICAERGPILKKQMLWEN